MHNFKELNVWKRSMQLAKSIYEVTSAFPAEEKYGLTQQIRRSVISIPSNIAEGCGRNSNKLMAVFLTNSLGSQYELETQLMLSLEIGFLNNSDFDQLVNELNEIQKMTHALVGKFRD